MISSPTAAPTWFAERVAREAVGQLRTFVDEVGNSTANYKTTHSLTEQVGHQYHGRFAIELLQNAHDALTSGERSGRVEFLLDHTEGQSGVLYVANDGRPFREEDVEALSRLGQSSKNPEESVGNKGLGFRSVLEICRGPEIYSTGQPGGSPGFDGFCFGFDPGIAARLAPTLRDLAEGALRTGNPFDADQPPLDWSPERQRQFAARLGEVPERWLRGELLELSPYLFPVPLAPSRAGARVGDFAARGFATVIRLPLTGPEALAQAESRLQELRRDETIVLFLSHLSALTVRLGADLEVMERRARALGAQGGPEAVRIRTQGAPAGDERVFWVWSREFGGDSHPEEARKITRAARNLPGRWPEVRKARLSVGVERSAQPEPGRYSIVLPTEEPTGLAAHLSGPFYGDMARRDIDFSKPLNRLFVSYLARMIRDAARDLAGKRARDAVVIIDLIAPLAGPQNTALTVLEAVWAPRPSEGPTLRGIPLVHTDQGWRKVGDVRVLNLLPGARYLTEPRLGRYARLPLAHRSIASRKGPLETLVKWLLGRSAALSDPEWRGLLEHAAAEVARGARGGNWTAYWEDVRTAFRGRRAILDGARILPGADGKVHMTSGAVRVFLPPRRESAEAGAATLVPKALAKRLAFLHPEIRLWEPIAGGRGGQQQTALHTFLLGPPPLVETFAVESILDRVVLPSLPGLPAPLGSRAAERCREILAWVRVLIQGRETTSIAARLRRLPVPCRGGWYAAGSAMFGRGWPGTVGDDLERVLEWDSRTSRISQPYRLLLPPDDEAWRGIGPDPAPFLRRLGVADGLLPLLFKAEGTWPDLKVSRWDVTFGAHGPNGLDRLWPAYLRAIRPLMKATWQRHYSYRFGDAYALPLMHRAQEAPEAERLALARVVLRSLGSWADTWMTMSIRKQGGESHQIQAPSPLQFTLRSLPWLTTGRAERRFASPGELWLVSPEMLRAAGEGAYRHLAPLSPDLLEMVGPRERAALEALGMPLYEPEKSRPDARLLERLADAWAQSSETIHVDAFIGQVRLAWRDFTPAGPDRFPSRLVLRQGGVLRVWKETDTEPFYLPDAPISRFAPGDLHRLPLLEIESPAAHRLAAAFQSRYGASLRPLSAVSTEVWAGGAPWSHAEGGELLRESDLRWLLAPALAIAAQRGARAYGTGTRSFRKGAEDLQAMRLRDATPLEIRMRFGQDLLSSAMTGAWLDTSANVLVVDRRLSGWMESLSEPLGQALGRSDLDVEVRLFLVGLGGVADPTRAQILNALLRLEIDEAGFRTAEAALAGDLPWILARLRPVTHQLAPACLPALDAAQTEPEILDVLVSWPPFGLEPLALVDLCRRAAGDADLGQELFDRLGEAFELGEWNLALAALGRPPVSRSTAIAEEFDLHRRALRSCLRAVCRGLARANPEARYAKLRDEVESLPSPESWQSRWCVAFMDVAGHFAAWTDGHGGAPLARALRGKDSVAAVFDALEALGAEPALDPTEIYAANLAGCRSAWDALRRVALLWCLERGVHLGPWTQMAEMEPAWKDVLAASGYLEPWAPAVSAALVRHRVPRIDVHAPLWAVLDRFLDLGECAAALGLDLDRLSQVEERIRQLEEQERRRARLVSVCGAEFDCDPANHGRLWSHIVGNLPAAADASLTETALLQPIGQGSGRGKRPGGPGAPGPGGRRLSQRMRELVGLAGEIHAYRALQAQYGAAVVGPAQWVSRNSELCFPGNGGNDELGYDFELNLDGLTWYVEVKASVDDGEVVELGESQVRAAVATAPRRGARFVILRVLDALSDSPGTELLPNPYENRSSAFYDLQNAGMRLRYRRASLRL
jgi:hypothetical protein